MAVLLPDVRAASISSSGGQMESYGNELPNGPPFPHPQMLGSLPHWDELLSSGLNVISRLLGAQWCALFLLNAGDGTSQEMELAGSWGEEEGAAPEKWAVLQGGPEWHAVRERVPVVALRSSVRWSGMSEAATKSRLYRCACAPLLLDGRCCGVLEVVRPAEGGPIVESELESLRLAADHLAVCLRSSNTHLSLGRLADTDGLTGVFNYRRFQGQLGIEVERSARHCRPLALMMLDLNNFKRYNDRFGHQQGDMALRIIANTLQGAVRGADVVARYGGDEFAIILPETSSAQALVVARRIEQSIRERGAGIGCPEAAECLGVSIGISSYPSLAGSKEELIAQADEALYRAKRRRREMIRVWQSGWRRHSKRWVQELDSSTELPHLFDFPPQ